MKKIIVILTFICCAGGAMAQSPITFGPKVGLNYNKIYNSDTQSNVDYNYIRTWSGGAFVRASIGKAYIQPEAYFNTKGSNLLIKKDPSNPATSDINGKIRLNSLDVPLLIGYKLVEGKHKKSNFRIFGGPVASFVLKEKENDLKILDDDSYTFNKTNIGVQVGAGFDLGNLTFDARYETGLNKVNSFFNPRTNLFQFTVGFKIL